MVTRKGEPMMRQSPMVINFFGKFTTSKVHRLYIRLTPLDLNCLDIFPSARWLRQNCIFLFLLPLSHCHSRLHEEIKTLEVLPVIKARHHLKRDINFQMMPANF